LGGVCGDGAVIDHQFGTTDVFMVLAMENVPDKYHDYFERDAPG
jgi:putative hemolysin